MCMHLNVILNVYFVYSVVFLYGQIILFGEFLIAKFVFTVREEWAKDTLVINNRYVLCYNDNFLSIITQFILQATLSLFCFCVGIFKHICWDLCCHSSYIDDRCVQLTACNENG